MKPTLLALAATTSVLACALPAHAALVNDYSAVDDVWNAPIAAGHFLVDVRTDYTLATSPTMLLLPVASLVYGVAPGWEVGVWGAYGLSAPGTAGMAAAPQILDPYVKAQLPWTLPKTTFGLVAGAQVPTAAGLDHDVALEGVASIQATDALLVDLGLGAGENLGPSGGTLGHANACGYYTLASGQTLFGEVYGNFSTVAPPTFAEQLGVQFPVTRQLSADVSATVAETGAGLAGVTPQLGATYAF